MKGEIESFVRGLGHEPNDLALFELAFTHSSVSRESYERLEFLGDRVLGMVIAAALYRRSELTIAPLQWFGRPRHLRRKRAGNRRASVDQVGQAGA